MKDPKANEKLIRQLDLQCTGNNMAPGSYHVMSRSSLLRMKESIKPRVKRPERVRRDDESCQRLPKAMAAAKIARAKERENEEAKSELQRKRDDVREALIVKQKRNMALEEAKRAITYTREDYRKFHSALQKTFINKEHDLQLKFKKRLNELEKAREDKLISKTDIWISRPKNNDELERKMAAQKRKQLLQDLGSQVEDKEGKKKKEWAMFEEEKQGLEKLSEEMMIERLQERYEKKKNERIVSNDIEKSQEIRKQNLADRALKEEQDELAREIYIEGKDKIAEICNKVKYNQSRRFIRDTESLLPFIKNEVLGPQPMVALISDEEREIVRKKKAKEAMKEMMRVNDIFIEKHRIAKQNEKMVAKQEKERYDRELYLWDEEMKRLGELRQIETENMKKCLSYQVEEKKYASKELKRLEEFLQRRDSLQQVEEDEFVAYAMKTIEEEREKGFDVYPVLKLIRERKNRKFY